MNRPLVVIYAAIVLDAVGIGLIFPILPSLLRDVTHSENVASTIGIMAALYAAMQFIFAPVLGSLSDLLGRRPVLLISLGGAAINYLFLAFTRVSRAGPRPRSGECSKAVMVGIIVSAFAFACQPSEGSSVQSLRMHRIVAAASPRGQR